MISVLLPIYNYPCASLLKEIHQQLIAENIPFEIIVMEDGSVSYTSENRDVCEKLNISYGICEKNIGRSAIRNLLATKATFEWLVFLDCDSRVVRTDFIHNYIVCATQNTGNVFCGGTRYQERENITDKFLLHWYYGAFRESVRSNNSSKRNFFSNNFLINRRLFLETKFEEKLSRYGHEDTLFGIELNRKNEFVALIENPVYHIGLNEAEQYLTKTRQAISNLRILSESFLHEEDFQHIRILSLYQKCHHLHLDFLLAKGYDWLSRLIEKQLKGKKPNLYLLDFYKLGFLCKIMRSDRLQ